jgi:small subunit ribosomal protein S9
MKPVLRSGKRKTSKARAVVKPGTGNVMVNNINIDNFTPKLARMMIREPLLIAGPSVVGKIDINVMTAGGGFMSQAKSARLAISRALVDYTKSTALKNAYLKYDRHLLVADVRRKETRKPNDSKARAKRQKSYR